MITRIFEVNTIPFLESLGIKKLNEIPDEILNAWRWKWEFDAIYFMGVWERTHIPWQKIQNDYFTDGDGRVWDKKEVITSAFSIKKYNVPTKLGGTKEMALLKQRLNDRGMKLILDFVPNHTARDSDWIQKHPEYYIREKDGTIVTGRSSANEVWQDTAQLNYHESNTKKAMLAELKKIKKICDGVRCDMAHLILNKKFDQIWSGYSFANTPQTEFWTEARSTVGPDFYMIAEAYGDTEYELIQCGFDATMDKDRFYDRLKNHLVLKKQGTPDSDIEGHIRGANASMIKTPQGEKPFGAFMIKFLENHDEQRSAKIFGTKLETALKIMMEQYGNPQGPLFFYNGQLIGAQIKTPVMVKKFAHEEPNEEILFLYEELLGVKENWRDTIPKKFKTPKGKTKKFLIHGR